MSDMEDDFRALREAKQQRRRSNTARSTELLRQRGIPFESKNGGAHLVVDGRVNFWPSTGLYIPLDFNKPKGRGVKNLLRFLSTDGKATKS